MTRGFGLMFYLGYVPGAYFLPERVHTALRVQGVNRRGKRKVC